MGLSHDPVQVTESGSKSSKGRYVLRFNIGEYNFKLWERRRGHLLYYVSYYLISHDAAPTVLVRETLNPILPCLRGLRGEHSKSQGKGVDL
jgi:hypothetical protein